MHALYPRNLYHTGSNEHDRNLSLALIGDLARAPFDPLGDLLTQPRLTPAPLDLPCQIHLPDLSHSMAYLLVPRSLSELKVNRAVSSYLLQDVDADVSTHQARGFLPGVLHRGCLDSNRSDPSAGCLAVAPALHDANHVLGR